MKPQSQKARGAPKKKLPAKKKPRRPPLAHQAGQQAMREQAHPNQGVAGPFFSPRSNYTTTPEQGYSLMSLSGTKFTPMKPRIGGLKSRGSHKDVAWTGGKPNVK
eukprot:CAMPEP_0168729564 /NCGR_PEP_ID=MMETSP0724-20121128/6269_1 /TAXON_ID=265536 /ORGANISM="Amphiprora sp., Strain CCMP467" /LENGTH=104 /DNA_ID=CAMNT_0008776453 /DNA_START=178 /DNA_END=492 /DNA_ORIENTATION=-